MKRRIERKWMYERRLDAHGLRREYEEGVDGFIEFAKRQRVFLDTSTFRCPCKKCKNLKHLDVDTVKLHLYKHGFENDYHEWVCHGEEYPVMPREGDFGIGKIDSDAFKTKSDRARKNRISDLANEDGKIDPGGHRQGSKSTFELEEEMKKRSHGTPPTALDQEDIDGEKKVVGKRAVELKEEVDKLIEDDNKTETFKSPNQAVFEAVGGWKKGAAPGLGSALPLLDTEPAPRCGNSVAPSAPSEITALHEHVNEYVRLLQEQRAQLDRIRAQLDKTCAHIEENQKLNA